MQNSSFDSINLDEYTLDIKEVLEDYIIEEDVYKQNYSVHKGTMKNATQKVRIYRRQFPNDAQSKERFRVLMAAFNQGIVLADNIFLSYENNSYYLYIVEPWFKGSNSKFVPLLHVLQTNISNAKKHRLFQNLVIIVKSLHELGEAHMELCPKNIWIEDEFQVYLRPFKLQFESSEKRKRSHSKKPNTKYWYSSPEYTLQTFNLLEGDSLNNSSDSLDSSVDKTVNHFTNDIWSLGCIFSDMFVSFTPIFQAAEPFDKLVKIFEVLGIPRKEDVFYMTKELYDSVIEHLQSRNQGGNQHPHIVSLVKNIPQEAAMVLTALLLFNPDKRPSCERLIQFPFFKASILSEYQGFFSSTEPSYREKTTTRSEARLSHNSMRQDQKTRNDSEASNVRIKTGSDRHNTSSWWNLDIFAEEPQGKGNSHRIGLENQGINHPEFASPTFVQGNETRDFPKVGNNTLKDSKNDSQRNYYDNKEQRIEDDPSRFSLAGTMSGNKNARDSYVNKSNAKGNYNYEEERPFAQSHSKSKAQYSERPSLPPLDPRSASFARHKTEEDLDVETKMANALRQSAMSRKSFKYDSKLMVSVEQLKNVLYREGSYCCKIELRTGTSEGETASIMSNYVPVENAFVRLDLRSEIDTLFETLERISKEDTLKIFIFYTSNQHHQIYNQSTEMLLYGVCEVNFDKLLTSTGKPMSNWNNPPKTLTGWYNVYDPDDTELAVGQLKVDLAWQMTGGSVTNSAHFQPVEERKSINKQQKPEIHMSKRKEEPIHNERKSLTTERARVNRRDHNEKENITSFSKPFMPKQSTAEKKKPLASKENVFDLISKNLEELNSELKHKEKEYKRESEILKQRNRDDFDFDLVVDKLREILEGEEEFCY